MSDSASQLAADHLSQDALDDAVLISRSRRTPECFAQLFDRHASALYRYVARRLGRDACDDLVAETFMVAFRGRARYDEAYADFAADTDPTSWAATIRKALGCGKFTTSGTERVDGVNAIKLTPVRPGAAHEVLWVDPATYLPVRVAYETRRSPKGPFTLGQLWDVQLLLPTAANLARLTMHIPAGFVQVPAPPESASSHAWYVKYVAPRL